MKKFIVLYRAPAAAIEQTKQMDPEEMKKGMAVWMEWAEKCGEGLVDLGTPLGGGVHLSSSGEKGDSLDVVGYSVLQAVDMEGAKKLLEGHPHLKWAEGCSLEVHECLPMPSGE